MLLLRACPHCGGDLVFERDTDSAYLECLQCGHTLSRVEERALGVHCARCGLVHVIAPPERRTAVRQAPAGVS
jgi:phage FluMu protein Com